MYKNFTKKIWLIMRLTTVIFIATLMQVSAATFAQRITINEQKASLEGVLKDIRTQSGYDFVFNRNFFIGTKPVNIAVNNASLEEALNVALSGQPLTYTIEGNAVVIKLKTPSFLEHVVNYFATIDISGSITDDQGNALIGATVTVKGSTRSVVTNGSGDFALTKVDEKAVLVITYLGYKTQEIKVSKNAANLKIILQQDISKLDEVTVEAYRIGSQRIATSGISKLTSEELMKQPVSNPLQALEGRIPGMIVSQVTGVPGARLSVQIRGRANFDPNLSNDQPLFIIDGVPMAAGNDRVNANTGPFGPTTTDGLSAFAGLNAADVESIDVLKDADATAIYGSRGANGVILITTKKGKAGKMKISATVYSGVSTVSKMPEMMNTQQYLEMRNEAFKNSGAVKTAITAYDLLSWDQNRYTDFAELLVGNNAKTNDAQLSLSGGDNTTQYRLGGGYHKEGTVWPGDKSADRASLNFNLHSSSDNKKFTIDFSGLYSISKSSLAAGDLATAISLPPNFQVYDAKGNLAWNENGVYDGRDNPLSLLNLVYLSTMTNLNANMILNYKITKGLVLRSSFGYNTTQTDDKRLMPISSQNPAKPGLSSLSLLGNTQFKNWIVEPQLEYTGKINKGKLNILAGGTFNKRNTTGSVARGTGYASDDLLENFAAATTVTVTNTLTQYNYQAVFGRINYNWEDKYIVNLTGRRDGSSRFGPDFRFSNFGAAGAAWIFSNENLLKDSEILSYGKLRASYGVTGNDQIGEYTYLDQYTSGSTYGDSSTLAPSKLFSPLLHWEGNKKLELGLELGFIKDRILLTASVYRNISSDPLVTYPLPKITGFSTVVNNLNGVKIENRGLELTLTTKNFNRSAFKWDTDFNLTLPKNELKAYPNFAASTYTTKYTIGNSLNQIYAGQFLGVDPTTGLYTIKDVNGDNLGSAADYAAAFDTDPKYYGGVNNTFSYKRFTASFFLQFTKQLGKDWRAANALNLPGTLYNFPTLALTRWQSEGQITDVQKYTTLPGSITGLSGTYAYTFSTGVYTDASYMRLKNVYLSYDLPKNWLDGIHISSCKFYVQAQNLFVITGYKGGDPEVQNYTRMAPLRTITGGLQVSL